MGLKGVLVGVCVGIVGLSGAVAAVGVSGGDETRGTVVRVVDGDTVIITVAGTDERVRLLNVDTPETHDPNDVVECLGPEATAFLESQLSPGDRVRLEYDLEERDRFGRLLAGVFEGEVLVNAEIARQGLGHPVVVEPNRKFYADVASAFAEAESNGVGYFDGSKSCTWLARETALMRSVETAETELAEDPRQASSSSAAAITAATTLLALIDGAEPGELSAAGYSVTDLAELRIAVAALATRAEAVAQEARIQVTALEQAEQLAREQAEKEAKEKAEREAKEKAEREAKERAEREAKAKAEQEAKEKAEREAREKAEREAAEKKAKEDAARAEAERKAEEERQAAEARRAEEARAAERARQQQSQIQPLVPQHPAPAPEPPADVYYANCDAVRAAGRAPIYVGQPGYRPALDRDRDGIGCE